MIYGDIFIKSNKNKYLGKYVVLRFWKCVVYSLDTIKVCWNSTSIANDSNKTSASANTPPRHYASYHARLQLPANTSALYFSAGNEILCYINAEQLNQYKYTIYALVFFLIITFPAVFLSKLIFRKNFFILPSSFAFSNASFLRVTFGF